MICVRISLPNRGTFQNRLALSSSHQHCLRNKEDTSFQNHLREVKIKFSPFSVLVAGSNAPLSL